MIQVKRYTATDQDAWDAFIGESKNGTFILKRGFMDYHKDRFDDHSLMVYDDQRLVAAVPAHVLKDTMYAHQGLTYGGFVWAKKIKFNEAFDCFQKVLAYADLQGIKNLVVKEIPRIYAQLPSDELDYFFHLAGANCIKKDVAMVIDYDEALGFEKNRREGLNRAKRHDLKVVCDNNFSAFWQEILTPGLAHKHKTHPVHSLAEIELLAERFPDNIKQVSVYHQGKLVAGTTVFLTPTVVHPQYVMGNDDKNKLGSIDLAYNYIIDHFAKGRRYFDFNTSSEQNGALLNSGLLFWKQSCGARCITINQYALETKNHNDLKLNLK
ncbi:MAG: GNAT family N-acetyltransferase [Flavobacteriaceae bacterium]